VSRASFCSVAAFLVFGAGGLALFFTLRPFFLGLAAFALMGLVGGVVAGRLFNRLASPEEKKREMEDRVRNSDL
jgi:hypothetical protein